jgi:hypothetical protein
MENNPDKPLKFVRLNMTREVVEVIAQSEVDVTVMYRGERVTLKRDEVIPVTPEE